MHTQIVIVPGWRDSGPQHWQCRWANELPHVLRVQQEDWETPKRQDWVDSLCKVIMSTRHKKLLVAHSLGCITVTHLPPYAMDRVAGAMLVAPADPERRAVLSDFAPVSSDVLPFPSVVVASDDDPFCPLRKAIKYARTWGSDIVKLKGAGHINVDSGFGPWPDGLEILANLQNVATSYTPEVCKVDDAFALIEIAA